MALDRIRVVFVDDGGVLNDNHLRAPQWRRLLGEYLVPRLGGTPEASATANGTKAETAAVVDDGPEQRRWAAAVGLRAFSNLSELLTALD